MSSVSFFHVGYITSISPGVTLHWWWNNATVRTRLDVQRGHHGPAEPTAIPGTSARLQVTSVEYRESYKGGSSLEKEVHFWMKNTGTRLPRTSPFTWQRSRNEKNKNEDRGAMRQVRKYRVDTHIGAEPPADALYEHIYSMLIGCGSCDKSLGVDSSSGRRS